MLNWQASLAEYELIAEIVERASEEKLILGNGTFASMNMDITAVHLNGCPLWLKQLRDFPIADFAHDIIGIQRHLNRQTGKLENCFLPRSASPTSESFEAYATAVNESTK